VQSAQLHPGQSDQHSSACRRPLKTQLPPQFQPKKHTKTCQGLDLLWLQEYRVRACVRACSCVATKSPSWQYLLWMMQGKVCGRGGAHFRHYGGRVWGYGVGVWQMQMSPEPGFETPLLSSSARSPCALSRRLARELRRTGSMSGRRVAATRGRSCGHSAQT
jgi:hypothetical protein